MYAAQIIPQIDAEIAEKAISGWKLIKVGRCFLAERAMESHLFFAK